MTLTCKASGKHSSGQISLVCGTDLAYRNGFCSFRLANKEEYRSNLSQWGHALVPWSEKENRTCEVCVRVSLPCS